jgi:hypothetical protein
MLKKLRARVNSAHLIALVALFVALGGTAVAALRVDSRDVVNNSLKSVDLKNGKGVKGADVKNGSLGTNDLANSAVTGGKVADGSLTGADIAQNGSLVAAHLGHVETGSFNVGSIPAGSCVSSGVNAVFSGADGNDIPIVVPTDNGSIQEPNFDNNGELVMFGIPHPGEAHIKVCNVSSGAIDPGPQGYMMVVIEG